MDSYQLQEEIVAFVRAFGLHKQGETPCGKPLSVGEAYVLMELLKEDLLSQQTLVERLNLAKSTVSRLIGQMLKRGWLTRTKNPADGRVWLLRLSESGEKLANEVGAARSQKFESILERIPISSRESVLDALQLLVEAARETTDE